MEQKDKTRDWMKVCLADALKQCMKKESLDKITIKEITERCGTTRQTFYRHFQDKYALVNWYFDKILLESFEHMGEGKTIYEGLVNKFTFIKKEKIFFKAAFKYDEQNNLRDHDFQLILAFYTERIEEKLGREIPEDLRFQLEMYCQGSIYMTVKWLMGNAKAAPQVLARQLVEAMPADLERVFQDLELL